MLSQSLAACIGRICSLLQPTASTVFAPALASFWYLRPRGSLLPSQNQRVFPAAKQWSFIPNTAVNTLSLQGMRQTARRQMTRMVETWDICNLKNLHLRSLCDHIPWMATPACFTKTIVGEVLIASTDQGNLKLVIVS